jgi:sensor histidine kinase YesM
MQASAARVGSRTPAEQRRSWLLGFAAASAVALLLFLYRYLDAVVGGRAAAVLPPLVNELTGVYGSALLLPLLIRFVRRHPLERGRILRELPAYTLAAALFGVTHTTLMWLSRRVLFGQLGLDDYAFRPTPERYAMELTLQLIVVGLTTAFVHVLDRYRAARERELRHSQLQASLARAQLQALQAQLQPHFLFNALNAISSAMYEDVERADTMIARLSDLLRHVLRTTRAQTISLEEELRILEPYLELMRARFGERLRVELDIEEGARAAAVPALLLQPLVENAAQHGTPEPPLPARIAVSARRLEGALVVEVADNGPGMPAGCTPTGQGIGLSNTAERLRALYGERAALEWENIQGGGFRVSVRLPFQQASPTPSPEEAVWSASPY